MRVLVTMETVDVSTEPEARGIWDAMVESFRRLIIWERDGRITGGCVTGTKTLQFIADVEELPDADRLAMALPCWAVSNTTTTPLVPFESRYRDLSSMVRKR